MTTTDTTQASPTLTADQVAILQQALAGGPFPGAVAQRIRDLRAALAAATPEVGGADAQFLLRLVNGITVPATAIDTIAGLQDTLQAIVAAAGLNANPGAGNLDQPPRPLPKVGPVPAAPPATPKAAGVP
ncbi:hypothetical protein AA12717_0409 [Gluconacetobacter sacchari DSM 12717]|uniref:Uncharacterized protein n=2 Tax=Gluconacetobacter sacchari TaxID=92759 RepID=A0A7W4IBY6_9PROT|nr:hypothetical protein [Gluconacetobacter sacchari]MBB2160075.1 hypothetical protein [Gluconacetobacter sacchari]GBQ19949.1 hypothetical protein AA12717_0409 [Gluconacetobacter sacchari DSM 12717]